METRNENTVIAFVSTHPGEILRAWLEDVDIKQKDFAITIGMPASRLNELIKGKRSMTEDIAQKLERALGVEASFWMRAQANYEYNERMLALRNDEQKNRCSRRYASIDFQPQRVIQTFWHHLHIFHTANARIILQTRRYIRRYDNPNCNCRLLQT